MVTANVQIEVRRARKERNAGVYLQQKTHKFQWHARVMDSCACRISQEGSGYVLVGHEGDHRGHQTEQHREHRKPFRRIDPVALFLCLHVFVVVFVTMVRDALLNQVTGHVHLDAVPPQTLLGGDFVTQVGEETAGVGQRLG